MVKKFKTSTTLTRTDAALAAKLSEPDWANCVLPIMVKDVTKLAGFAAPGHFPTWREVLEPAPVGVKVRTRVTINKNNVSDSITCSNTPIAIHVST
jgi:hypothetical protein